VPFFQTRLVADERGKERGVRKKWLNIKMNRQIQTWVIARGLL
jgi:hypothetical protein